MTGSPTARLVLPVVDPAIEARLRYAFSAYAALHGIRVLDTPGADVRIGYGPAAADVDLTLAAGYRPRPAAATAPAPTWVDGMPCFHLAPGGEPDILGEVFEWLAAPHEAACTRLDGVGRVPPEHTLAGTHRLDRRVPWVNRWLARLHAQVRTVLPRLPAAPPSPFGPGNTFVASHDLDHLSGRPLRNAARVAKNVGIALAGRDLGAGVQIVGAAAQRLRQRRPTVVGIDELLAGQAERGVRASYTVVAESTHRRDPGYRLDEPYVQRTLRRISAAGHELAVHGSYRSLQPADQLVREYRLLEAAGHPAVGGRQHWLRHRGGELFDALAAAGAQWDSTIGHPDVIGYRNGAAFPYLPYDLERERPRPIVEIPLVVMERALCTTADDPASWPGIAIDVLRAAGTDGWGGTAVLWHDYAMTGTTLPAPLAGAFWTVLDAGDRWLPAAAVAAAARERWAAAGAPDAASAPVRTPADAPRTG
jgi:hypothetical protein